MNDSVVFLASVLCVATTALSATPDPFVGTQNRGNTTPAATYPFGLVQPGPDTSEKPDVLNLNPFHASGYQYGDRFIWRFSQLHFSGTGGPGLGNIGIMPFGGVWNGFPALPLVKETERAEPGYYAVDVENGLGRTRCEMTALRRTAMYRFRWTDRTRPAKLLVDLDWLLGHTEDPELWGWGHVVHGCGLTRDGKDGIVAGWQHSKQWTKHTVYFVMRPSQPVRSVVKIRERDGITGETYVLDFGVIPEGELRLEMGISNRSESGAERNLTAELVGKSFEDVRRACAAAWRNALGWYELDPSTPEEVRGNFDAAAYHLAFQPNLVSDVGEPDDYSTFSLWDTFRAAHPLYALVHPKENAAFVRSMLDQYDRQGYLPIWAVSGDENHCMIGHHAVPVVVDAYLQGQIPADQVERAYRAVKNSLTVQHCAVNGGCWGLTKEDWKVYDRHGYYPFDGLSGYDALSGRKVIGESVARTLECSYDDACAARFAEALGKREDAAFFRKRSGNWKNVIDPSLGLARGRDSTGKWREPFDRYANGEGPFADNDFCEGGAMQYTWHVLHDPAGLSEVLGGKKAMGERLDALFAERPPQAGDAGFGYAQTGCLGMCVHGNEISHHIAYLYAHTDRPEKAGPILRRICEMNYRPRPDGLCGNDDCGQMSAWYLFTALGFYPLDPCGGDFVLGAPQVPGARIRLGSGRTLRISTRNFGSANPCVRTVTFNGVPVENHILRHAEISNGGDLVFEMCETRGL